jgi:hypothetical protein
MKNSLVIKFILRRPGLFVSNIFLWESIILMLIFVREEIVWRNFYILLAITIVLSITWIVSLVRYIRCHHNRSYRHRRD